MEFYADEIEVRFHKEPALEKKPGPPVAFTWRGREYVIVEVLKEWHDYRKRGKSRAFYAKERGSYWATASQRQGSWGVGRDYYRVRTEDGEVFDIYYDRAPKGQDRKGQWILSRKHRRKREAD
ncbi:MAG: hypothetical protein GTO63_28070 [Anaerolineae bacterium]|nr:hypothetical protein [Anaerolineae bacterium]NIN98600.1 hypothetical protein [Anaerolineae bacterium]NIQ81484.1 hypothetical protein [Anaerolineae bacterium]